MGVHTSLPLDGVDVILGNDLAGAKGWKDDPPSLELTSMPDWTQDECVKQHPHVFPVCAVTHAMSKTHSKNSGSSTVGGSQCILLQVKLQMKF